MRNKKALTATIFALLLSGLITGCSANSEPAAEPETSKSPELSFYPTGSASNNLPVFEKVMQLSGAGKPNHDVAKSIALLVDTGFDIEEITHTAIDSKIGEPVDSVSLAVAIGGECLIAQFSSSWLTTTVAKELASGCLIGDVQKASVDSGQ